ncbi:hypothetical protein NQ314_000526 [Rhamnusium bicolor]|uniref:PiggyBac transposable element-derived protein domain-containing protein n=1 Tax=Rhamnusium bicolor TaxID=1586634 RepID=A0AAV8ZV72_9CUCU|nr:hypothetical protein NQ314_000526 [Rhamnusium bicolor]
MVLVSNFKKNYEETGKSINIVENEVHDFVTIHILMGIEDTPSYLDYWSKEFRYNNIADVMPLKRYHQIRRYIHFVNNRNQNDDPYFKISPVLDIIRRNCMQIENERRQNIDEMMVPYKGKKAGSKRQYIKSKPKEWGCKIFVRPGISGFVYDFIIYSGENTFIQHLNFSNEEMDMRLDAKVVIGLCKSIKQRVCMSILTIFILPSIYYLLYEIDMEYWLWVL